MVSPYINMNPPQVYTCSPSWTPLPSPSPYQPLGHPSAPAPSIQYHASNLDWWFISYMILYMFQCHSPKSSHPLPLPQSPKDCSIHLCLFYCLAYRVIVTIFLNSIYMRWYTALVFFLLAYFTLYNRLQFHSHLVHSPLREDEKWSLDYWELANEWALIVWGKPVVSVTRVL